MEIKNNNLAFKQRKIPKYIYHFTNASNYKSMQKDGFIKTSYRDCYLEEGGIFAIELQNFLKHWGFNKSWDNGNKEESLRTSLLRQVAIWGKSFEKGHNELVILKIPTDKLDKSKLKIRSQSKFFNLFYSDKSINKVDISTQRHLKGHTPAEEARLYKNKKEAIEYIYQDDIPMDKVEKIGNTVNIFELRTKTKLNQEEITKLTLKEAFANTPQSKEMFLL